MRYKCNLLGKYLDAKNPPKKVPNVISLVIYHGEKEYPYSTDVVACFEDEGLAANDRVEPMQLLDLAKIPEEVILQHGGADMLLKLLLKYSRKKDFIQRILALMEQHPNIFVSLPTAQANFIFEYILHVGKGTPANASTMKATMNQLYGKAKADQFFSLADYFKQKLRKEGIQQGMLKKRISKGRYPRTIKKMVAKGRLTQREAEENDAWWVVRSSSAIQYFV